MRIPFFVTKPVSIDTMYIVTNLINGSGYKARVEVIHEIVEGVEMLYWRDIDTDWSEGMNEYGIGIVNSSLLVREDEKEGDKVNKVSGYKYPGIIVSVFTNTKGDIRYVVECIGEGVEGMLHIFNENQLELTK